MENSVTVNAHAYKLTRQEPTGQVRSAIVDGVQYSLTTAYQSTKQGGAPVIRSQRKVTVLAPVTVNGSTELRAIEISYVVSRPTDVLVTNPNLVAALAEMKVWINTATFTDEILNNEI